MDCIENYCSLKRIIMDCIENYCSLKSWPEKREIYDRHGEETLKDGMGAGGAAQNNPFDPF
jgi:DnaJ-class molecular chaperone